ncbi:MAG: metal ABC transporter ATP-binding protein [Planctomycetota bacterium]
MFCATMLQQRSRRPRRSDATLQPETPIEQAVRVDGLTFAYPGAAHAAIEQVSFAIDRGERLGVLGPNGGGKSTLVKLMLGVERPQSGSVTVFGSKPDRARRDGVIGYVPQRSTADTSFPLSVRDVVRMPLDASLGSFGRLRAEDDEHLDRVIDLVGLRPLAGRGIGDLSGGQLQRAMIARAVANRPKLLLLDEPTVGIDVSGQRRFSSMLETLASELSLTVVTVTHDLRTVALASDRVACLRRTLHYHDAPLGLTPGVLAELFSHDIEAVFGDADAFDHGTTHTHGAGTVHRAGDDAND